MRGTIIAENWEKIVMWAQEVAKLIYELLKTEKSESRIRALLYVYDYVEYGVKNKALDPVVLLRKLIWLEDAYEDSEEVIKKLRELRAKAPSL